MDVLSTADGSAQAVREAVDAGSDSRMALERELDRLNAALLAHSQIAAQQLNWTLLAQAFLLTSYVIVLVGGWSVALPGKRWLLAAIAGYAALSVLLGYLAQRGTRNRLAPLHASRRLVEEALERVANRPAVFSRERLVTVVVGDWAARTLPVAMLCGWTALALYTLGLPLPTDSRPVAEVRGETRSTNAQAAAPARKAAPRKADDAAPTPADAPPSADGESPLAALLRRAINTAPAEQADTVKP